MQKVVQMNGKQLRPLYLREAKNRKDAQGKKGRVMQRKQLKNA